MPNFSQRSLDRLNTCHEDLAALFSEVVKTFDCSVLCGHRNQRDQNEALDAGRSKVAWPKSKHNAYPSMAADVVPYPVDWQDTKRFYLFAGYVLATANHLYQIGAITHRIRWGGDWDGDTDIRDQSFNDLPHFELVKPQ